VLRQAQWPKVPVWDTANRWAWVQITPWASAADTHHALAEVSGRALTNFNAAVRLVSERDPRIEPFEGADSVWAREQHAQGPDGPGVVLMLAGTVSNWLAVVCLSGSPIWDWTSASDVATLQGASLIN